ncbi:MAG: HEAT repeat domain-containing protein [Planctomycetes bacterium]|nr:HEAT repeat domain-containing protein [Planctomycetota bacterium]
MMDGAQRNGDAPGRPPAPLARVIPHEHRRARRPGRWLALAGTAGAALFLFTAWDRERRICDLVEQLNSTEPTRAESARRRLVALGEEAVPRLADYLDFDAVPGPLTRLRYGAVGRSGRDLRVEVIETLRRMGEPGVAALTPLLEHDSRDFRARAVRALGSLARPDLLGALRARCADPDPTVRAEAAAAIGYDPSPETTATLAALLFDPAAETRAAAAETLASGARPGAGVVLFSRLAATPDAGERAALRAGIARLTPGERTALVVHWANDGWPAATGGWPLALAVLADDPGPEAYAPLVEGLFAVDRWWELCDVLSSRYGRGRLAPDLISILLDPARAARAGYALRHLTGEDLPPDYGRWRAWWESRRD